MGVWGRSPQEKPQPNQNGLSQNGYGTVRATANTGLSCVYKYFVGDEIGVLVKVSSCMYLPANHRSYMQNNPSGKHGPVLRLLRASLPPLSCKEDQAQSYIRIELLYFKADQAQNQLMK